MTEQIGRFGGRREQEKGERKAKSDRHGGGGRDGENERQMR